MAKKKTIKVDRQAEYNLFCGLCGKDMPKGTDVYLIKPKDWRSSWTSKVSGCRECAEKAKA